MVVERLGLVEEAVVLSIQDHMWMTCAMGSTLC